MGHWMDGEKYSTARYLVTLLWLNLTYDVPQHPFVQFDEAPYSTNGSFKEPYWLLPKYLTWTPALENQATYSRQQHCSLTPVVPFERLQSFLLFSGNSYFRIWMPRKKIETKMQNLETAPLQTKFNRSNMQLASR